MKNSPSSYQRKGQRALPHILGSCVGIVVVFLGFLLARIFFQSVPYRQSLVVVGNPVHLVSWNAGKNQVTILDVPDDVTINATEGYGAYSLGSLFTLDQLDHKQGSVFVSSVSDAVGLPVSWYIVPNVSTTNITGVSLVRSIFSWGNLWRVLTHQMDGSMPLSTWVSFVIASQSLSADAVTVVNAADAFIQTQLPDGSSTKVLDPSRLDFLIDNAFLDSGLRSEGISIAVYNTTSVPSVGLRAARVMSHLGLQLVFVGNAASEKSTCFVSGSSKALSTKTAQFIREYFRCVNTVLPATDINTVADLSLYLGTQYADQFIPQ